MTSPQAEHPNARMIQGFYASLARHDGAAMASCYHADATFRDPVFSLAGWEVGAMWRMLCERGKDLRVECSNVRAGDRQGAAHWDAWYTFSASGRKVHNSIDAEFTLRDGQILQHVDHFDLYRWSRQALGAKGLLLGWTPLVQSAIRRTASRSLASWARQNGMGPAAA
jgi:ketosteroid isomerase-like protein